MEKTANAGGGDKYAAGYILWRRDRTKAKRTVKHGIDDIHGIDIYKDICGKAVPRVVEIRSHALAARAAGGNGGRKQSWRTAENGGAERAEKRGVLRGKARNGCGGANHLTFRAREVILKLAFVREWSSEGRRSGG